MSPSDAKLTRAVLGVPAGNPRINSDLIVAVPVNYSLNIKGDHMKPLAEAGVVRHIVDGNDLAYENSRPWYDFARGCGLCPELDSKL